MNCTTNTKRLTIRLFPAFVLFSLQLSHASTMGMKDVDVLITNASPLKISFLMAFDGLDSAEAQYWYSVDAGSRRELHLRVPVEVSFIGVYGQRFDNPVEAHLAKRLTLLDTGVPTADWFYEADEDDSTVWWPLPTSAEAGKKVRGSMRINAVPDQPGFAQIPLKLIEIREADGKFCAEVLAVHPSAIYALDALVTGGGDLELHEAMSRAKELRAAILNQFAFYGYKQKLDETGNLPEDGGLPFRLGLKLSDEVGAHMPGVRIDHVLSPRSIWDDELPWRVGEHIIEINGKPIFGHEDLALLLAEHAFKHGIEVPLVVHTIDPEHILHRLIVTYRFDEQWGRKNLSEAQAFVLAAVNSAALDAGPTALELGTRAIGTALNFSTAIAAYVGNLEYRPVYAPERTFEEAIFGRTQMVHLARQLYPEEFEAGSFAGLFAPSPLSLLRLPLRGAARSATGSRLLAQGVSSASIGAAESAIFSYATSSPLLTEDARRSLALSLAQLGGTLEGLGGVLLSRRHK